MSGKSRLPRLVLLADVLAGIFATLLTWFIVSGFPAFAVHSRNDLSVFDFMFYISFVLLTLTGIFLGGDYVSQKRYSRLADISLVLKSGLVAFALLVCSAFVLEDFVFAEHDDFSRPGIIIMITTFMASILAIRVVAHKSQIKLFGRGGWLKKMVIVGAGPEAVDLYQHLQTKDWLGVKCVGFVDEKATVSPVADIPLLGKVADLPRLVQEREVGEIVIALPPEDHSLMEKIVNNGVRRNVKVRIIPDSFAYPYSNLNIQEYDGLAMIDVRQPSLDAMHRGLKRFIDISFAMVLIIIDLPLMIPIIIMIRMTSKGPAIFRQTRLGKDGEPFEMMKFRSMYADAPELREKLKRRNEATGAMFKMKEDPRITGFGRFIRRTSLDELPQLFNILRGDMSLVGPRPPLPDEVGRYHAHHLKRLAVRPGVTGLWQVSGRDRRDFEEMSRLDLYYIENWSIMLDLKIILKTVPVVLSRRGAY
ncbi:MAG: sugar transferase [Thermoleophilia bacterium]